MEYEGMWVPGDPKTKGSWIPVQTRSGVKFRPATKGGSRWYKTAADAVAAQWRGPFIEEGPVEVRLVFLLPRRKTVKRKYPTSRYDGDGDKLERAIWDAMTGTVYRDDSQVVRWRGEKLYADGETGAWVYVSTDL